MLKKTITYEDYYGNSITEDFRFNLNKSEVAKMELTTPGGLQNYVQKLTKDMNGKNITDFFEKLILSSYGEISLDGKKFIKVDENGKELYKDFVQTDAYNVLFMELVTDSEAAAKFLEGILPKAPNPNGSIPAPASLTTVK